MKSRSLAAYPVIPRNICQVKGGGQCSLKNYRTLCVPCHTIATKRLAGERAAARARNEDKSIGTKSSTTSRGADLTKKRTRARQRVARKEISDVGSDMASDVSSDCDGIDSSDSACVCLGEVCEEMKGPGDLDGKGSGIVNAGEMITIGEVDSERMGKARQSPGGFVVESPPRHPGMADNTWARRNDSAFNTRL